MKAYDLINNKIIEALEKGVIPWKKSWNCTGGSPKNLVSNHFYQGINVWILLWESLSKDYTSPYWVTFLQAKKLGGSVRKGEKATPIAFWNFIDKTIIREDGNEEEKKIPLLRTYFVFNVEQCEGFDYPKEKQFENKESIKKQCEKIIKEFKDKPEILNKGSQPCYNPVTDRVKIPALKEFKSSDYYYHTLFHELIHSTGHKKRLNRNIEDSYNLDSYSKEELIAELGSAYLSFAGGIGEAIVNESASYIEGWIKKLKEDNRFLISASGKAQKAANYILNKETKTNQKKEEKAA